MKMLKMFKKKLIKLKEQQMYDLYLNNSDY